MAEYYEKNGWHGLHFPSGMKATRLKTILDELDEEDALSSKKRVEEKSYTDAMERTKKFLRSVDKKLREQLSKINDRTINNDLAGLDIKQLQGTENLYRCRFRDVRIIFLIVKNGDNIIVDMAFRGGAKK